MAGEYVVDRGTGKMELHFSYAEYQALPADLKDMVKRYFTWSRTRSAWVSKGQADSWAPQDIAKRLGFQKGEDVGEKQSFAEKMEAKAERAEERADRYDEYAQNAARRADSLSSGYRKFSQDIAFMTQPGHIPFRERIIRQYERSWEESNKAQHFKGEAGRLREVADRGELQNRVYLDNRIKENEAHLRRIEKSIADWERRPKEETDKHPEYAASMEADYVDVLDKLAYYKDAMEALGGVQYGKHNVSKGDLVRIRGRWGVVASTGPKNMKVDTDVGMRLSYAYSEVQEIKRKPGSAAPVELPAPVAGAPGGPAAGPQERLWPAPVPVESPDLDIGRAQRGLLRERYSAAQWGRRPFAIPRLSR